MIFSLINVRTQVGEQVSGMWIQDHIGTLESARLVAKRTEAVNGHRITVAVVAALTSPSLLHGSYDHLRRLD
jgi:hypothetical protein